MSKVSVIIPTYNYARFISNAIDSVLNQTYTNIEIIIVDDGSVDNTKYVLSQYTDVIKYYYQDNKGPASARNLGIKHSTGEYICFLDSDDAFIEDKIDIQLNEFSKNKNIGLIYSDFYISNNNLDSIYRYYKCKSFKDHESAFKYLLYTNYINTSSVMLRRDCLFNVGLFNESYKYLEDYDLWIRLGMKYEFLYIDKPLVKTRAHFKSYSKAVDIYEKTWCTNEIRKNISRYNL
ncbi:glycosyltransferase [Alkalithermobacter paradoxus]|uniref:UDP-Glc:alpha-D-GlcNAc-diphosphoundecaprenol beta-1,3-glucosyltransferase WfgD n=1 Tax=Alkalithermobacter paradoxus TaxID=29349 RepID=A0A1V4IA55_9FIRM|nr:UDP-Glc:alpha-D-GlcNAc-diphosphoundecaprenol beta-1,3-glucosyltransferase WfgD [[Clostridium] thermoalcaliphilum]